MKVRYVQLNECLVKCGAYWSPLVDINEDPEIDIADDYEAQKEIAERVITAWAEYGGDDNLHIPHGIIFEYDDRDVYWSLQWSGAPLGPLTDPTVHSVKRIGVVSRTAY